MLPFPTPPVSADASSSANEDPDLAVHCRCRVPICIEFTCTARVASARIATSLPRRRLDQPVAVSERASRIAIAEAGNLAVDGPTTWSNSENQDPTCPSAEQLAEAFHPASGDARSGRSDSSSGRRTNQVGRFGGRNAGIAQSSATQSLSQRPCDRRIRRLPRIREPSSRLLRKAILRRRVPGWPASSRIPIR